MTWDGKDQHSDDAEAMLQRLLDFAEREKNITIFDRTEVEQIRAALACYDTMKHHSGDLIKAARMMAMLESTAMIGKTLLWLIVTLGGALIAYDNIIGRLTK